MDQQSYGYRLASLRKRLAQALLREPAVVLLDRDADDTMPTIDAPQMIAIGPRERRSYNADAIV